MKEFTFTPDDMDRRIIAATQAGLPLVREPYQAVAREVGTTEEDVMARLERMQAFGVIRRIGVVPNHYKLGYTANGMTVWDVADADVDAAGETIGAFDFVSHCYRRPRHLPHWPYNLFAMVHGRSAEEVGEKMERIAAHLGSRAHGHQVLMSTRILKKTGLRIAA
jgi:DNA-binding Lrp family transcriptional regulator